MHPDLEPLLSGASALLLDFDGPICSLYAGTSDRVAADRVRAVLTEVPEHIARTSDPLEVLTYAAQTEDEALIRRADEALVLFEIEAVETASPAPAAGDAIAAAVQAGKRVAIVSNNCEAAIFLYLLEHGLIGDITTIAGRPSGRPELMKPDPDSLLRAMAELHVLPTDCVLVGDSVSDIAAARAVGVPCIGIAASLTAHAQLRSAGADLVLGEDAMQQIADSLR
jgi:HAD superfamily hydrolase (TIGR01509 family)